MLGERLPCPEGGSRKALFVDQRVRRVVTPRRRHEALASRIVADIELPGPQEALAPSEEVSVVVGQAIDGRSRASAVTSDSWSCQPRRCLVLS
ncbi:hypothetical protein BE08_15260 [Sorangium cellulosum]|uniref:Uncharacterized protein n=1 Tax=Sorangium cellulosum TaxID=56 RepID=A0A150P2S2_SORCE|nr:hypothetical protein BE08_15260 [Sorangium cellulosum]